MKVWTVEANDVEIQIMEEKEQCLGIFLQPGTFELGCDLKHMTKASYGVDDMFVFPRNRRVLVKMVRASYMIVRVSDSALKKSGEELTPGRIQDKRIHGLMIAINAERLAGFPSGQLFLDSVELALGSILEQLHPANMIPTRTYRNGLAPYRLRKVVELINENIRCDLSLQKLADTAGLSISHFSLMFKKSTGISPHRYLLRNRIHMARDLLLHSTDSIRDVAYACGFKTHQHFAREFRREFHINPVECRNSRPVKRCPH